MGLFPNLPFFIHRSKTPSTADYSADEADEETHAYLQREIEEAELNGYNQGKPGGLLNWQIADGNRKPEEQLAREAQRKDDGVIR